MYVSTHTLSLHICTLIICTTLVSDKSCIYEKLISSTDAHIYIHSTTFIIFCLIHTPYIDGLSRAYILFLNLHSVMKSRPRPSSPKWKTDLGPINPTYKHTHKTHIHTYTLIHTFTHIYTYTHIHLFIHTSNWKASVLMKCVDESRVYRHVCL